MSKNLYKKCCICKKYFKENDTCQGEINLKFMYYEDHSKATLDICGECTYKHFGDIFKDDCFKDMIEKDYEYNRGNHNMRIDFF